MSIENILIRSINIIAIANIGIVYFVFLAD